MLIKSFPLVKPGVFEARFNEIKTDKIIVRPDLLSICAADMRYFLGLRPKEILNKKLPMVLIHEAIGTVLNNRGNLKKGDKVVLLPCGVNSAVNTNYKENAYFRSSNADGFCQEILNLDESEVIKVPSDNYEIYVLSELISVCFQGIKQLRGNVSEGMKIGIWGDGTLAYLMCLLIRKLYMNVDICVIGKHENKLSNFSCASEMETIFHRKNKNFDLCIECVGGRGAEMAIDDMINTVNPLGEVLLMGVSEIPPKVNTRKILEKGLTIKGTTRSVRSDFEDAIKFIGCLNNIDRLKFLFSSVNVATNEIEIRNLFEHSKIDTFKSLIKLNI